MENNKLQPLNDVEKRMSEEHHGLVYSFLHRHGYSIEEFYNICIFVQRLCGPRAGIPLRKLRAVQAVKVRGNGPAVIGERVILHQGQGLVRGGRFRLGSRHGHGRLLRCLRRQNFLGRRILGRFFRGRLLNGRLGRFHARATAKQNRRDKRNVSSFHRGDIFAPRTQVNKNSDRKRSGFYILYLQKSAFAKIIRTFANEEENISKIHRFNYGFTLD